MNYNYNQEFDIEIPEFTEFFPYPRPYWDDSTIRYHVKTSFPEQLPNVEQIVHLYHCYIYNWVAVNPEEHF